MNYRLTVKNIKENLDGLKAQGEPLFRFVETIEQTCLVLEKFRNADTCPVEDTPVFEADLESHFSRNKDAAYKSMTNPNLLYFLLGGNRRLVSDNTYMSHLFNAKPSSKTFYDLLIRDLASWKLAPGEAGGKRFINCNKAGVPDGSVSPIDYIVQENDLIISSFCSRRAQAALRGLLREYAGNICDAECTEPEWTDEIKPEHVQLVTMDPVLVKELSGLLEVLVGLAEASEGKGLQPRYLAEGLTWLLIASLLRGKLSAVQRELDRAVRNANKAVKEIGTIGSAAFLHSQRLPVHDHTKELYGRLMERFRYTRNQHPSIRMMEPDPDLFPKGLPAISNLGRTTIESKKEPISIKDMVIKSWAEHKHLLLIGEGGIGKTVAMLTLPDNEWIKERQIPAIYIPLHNLKGYDIRPGISPHRRALRSSHHW